jgi:hypothetical protein
LIAAVSRNNIETTAMTNPMGLYKAWMKTRNEHNTTVTIVAYYATSPNTLPTTPPGGNSKWYDNVVSLFPRHTRSTEEKEQRNKSCLPEVGSMPTTTLAPTQKKRRGEAIIRNGATGQFAMTNNPERAMKQACSSEDMKGQQDSSEVPPSQEQTPLQQTNQPASEVIQTGSWWESTDAYSLLRELKLITIKRMHGMRE